jgi:outer membrane lipase/esterase
MLTHGPYVGLTLQRVHVDGFTETSTGPVALSFADQTRNSAVGALGYRLNWDLGTFKPFANIAWQHEFASDDRRVTASLTTITAPRYSLPAVTVGRDWAAATAGTLVDLGNGVTAHGSVTSSLGQDNVVTHGGRVGLSIGY